MPSIFKVDYDAIMKELEIWRANHNGMQPFFIASDETMKVLEADSSYRHPIRAFEVPSLKTCSQIMGVNVAICNALSLGEFKVR